MNILFIGDVFGEAGRRVLAERLKSLKVETAADVVIANGENVAGGKGITHALHGKLRHYGVDVVTGGNHSFANADILNDYHGDARLLRPLNLPAGNAGTGQSAVFLDNGTCLGVVNLQGRIYFHENLDDPFRAGLAAITELRKTTPCIFVDFHAEATSEKIAFAQYVDGKASAVIGTHTHVQTADERILPGGTAFITDAGMTGPEDSVIGMKSEIVIKKFLLQTHQRFEPSVKGPMLNAVLITVDDQSGKALAIRRIYERLEFAP
ncbi:MAG: TIGR00282 family metallophosphoesterase [Chitinivibrionales bacterium]|nr:TIGR00282 family metallophosphoesterase [Chitinivibrionales bacterium]